MSFFVWREVRCCFFERKEFLAVFSSSITSFAIERISAIITASSWVRIIATIKKYIQEQEKHDIATDKLSVKEYEDPFKG